MTPLQTYLFNWNYLSKKEYYEYFFKKVCPPDINIHSTYFDYFSYTLVRYRINISVDSSVII